MVTIAADPSVLLRSKFLRYFSCLNRILQHPKRPLKVLVSIAASFTCKQPTSFSLYRAGKVVLKISSKVMTSKVRGLRCFFFFAVIFS